VASALHFHLRQAGMAAMQNIATTSDDLENREINAAEIRGVYLFLMQEGFSRDTIPKPYYKAERLI
jgi:hypothetical protein